MLHLFNKVYVSSDKLLDINFDRIVISSTLGVKMISNSEYVANGELVAHATSLNDLFTDQRIINFSGLIELADSFSTNSNKVFMIYLDDESFTNFMSLWIKGIFSQIDSSSAWKLIKLYIDKEQSYQSWRMNTASMTVNLFSEVTQSQFETVFSATPTTDLGETYNRIKRGLSLEYLIASFLTNGSSQTEVGISLKNILHRSLQEFLLEVKYNVYKNQYKSSFNYDIDLDFFGNSTLYTSHMLGAVGSQSHTDIVGASDTDLTKLINIASQINLDWEGFNPDSPVCARTNLFQYIRRDLNSEDINYLINLEKVSKSNNRIYSTADEEKINIYLLDFILNSDQSEVQKFLLK